MQWLCQPAAARGDCLGRPFADRQGSILSAKSVCAASAARAGMSRNVNNLAEGCCFL
ncbi:MAG: hypothetical protein BIFFINMI_01955 [Phycisphaerae bacterium]|nr:hypothetical protein [Phycisphaerae bacterium]